jgi:TrpR-related protein YerC/YecD
MSKDLHSENLDNLLDGILTLRTREEAYRFFEDLCTVGEIEALQQRFAVARMLRSDQTYQDIAEATGASTATISRVRRALDYGDDGYDLVLKRLDGEGDD